MLTLIGIGQHASSPDPLQQFFLLAHFASQLHNAASVVLAAVTPITVFGVTLLALPYMEGKDRSSSMLLALAALTYVMENAIEIHFGGSATDALEVRLTLSALGNGCLIASFAAQFFRWRPIPSNAKWLLNATPPLLKTFTILVSSAFTLWFGQWFDEKLSFVAAVLATAALVWRCRESSRFTILLMFAAGSTWTIAQNWWWTGGTLVHDASRIGILAAAFLNASLTPPSLRRKLREFGSTARKIISRLMWFRGQP